MSTPTLEYDLPNSQHVIGYWQLFYSIPKSQNPLYDNGPQLNTSGQDPSTGLVYLPGNMGGKTEKSGNLPEGVSLFIPIINMVESIAEIKGTKGNEATISDLDEITKADQDSVTECHVNINGSGMYKEDLEQYRIHTEPFPVTIPSEGIFDSVEGPSTAVADGYFIMTKPLSPGTYNIEFSGALKDFQTENYYHLTIQ